MTLREALEKQIEWMELGISADTMSIVVWTHKRDHDRAYDMSIRIERTKAIIEDLKRILENSN